MTLAIYTINYNIMKDIIVLQKTNRLCQQEPLTCLNKQIYKIRSFIYQI
jgi:hypothetical protein